MKVIKKPQNIIHFISKFKDKETLHVAHGCNCFCAMGAGAAKALDVHTYGKLSAADWDFGRFGDINKLGEWSSHHDDDGITYYNCYTQFGIKGYGQEGVYVYWNAVYKSLISIVNGPMNEGDTLVIVPIGTGLAGGDYKDFERVIDRVARNAKIDVTLVICDNER